MTTDWINTNQHAIESVRYMAQCQTELDTEGALVLNSFFTPDAIAKVIAQSSPLEQNAFYARSTHNVYLTPPNPDLPSTHTYNRQVASSKGLIADDQVPDTSPLRSLYNDPRFRNFLCSVLGIEDIYPYADGLSSINVHFAAAGQELGWHFDNSAFAVTMLLQAPSAGGVFEYVPAVRNAETQDMAYDKVAAVLDGDERTRILDFAPGDLVLFRGRDAIHRVTPTIGDVTRMLVVFAFNERQGVQLSDSALMTFYGRTA